MAPRPRSSARRMVNRSRRLTGHLYARKPTNGACDWASHAWFLRPRRLCTVRRHRPVGPGRRIHLESMIADHERPCDPTVATLAIVTSLERVSGPSRRVKQLLPVRMLSLTDDRRSCRWRIVRQQPRHKHLTDAPTLQRPAKLPPKLRSRSRMRLIGDRGNDHRTRRHRQGRALSTEYRAGARARFSGKGAALTSIFRATCSGRM